MTDNGFSTEPGFVDPDDDGVHGYLDCDGRRITKAAWLAWDAEQQKLFDAAAAKELPLSAMARYRLAEAGSDFQYHLEMIATELAREAGRCEVGWEDVCQATARAFEILRGA